MAFGSRMEAATEALLRVRDEVVTTLDRQVIELQQIHRALAYAPPPMLVTEDAPRALIAEAAPTTGRPSLFEDAPRFPAMSLAPAAPVVQVAQVAPFAPMRPQRVEVAVATVEETGFSFPEAALDPMLERATLDELNDALASAFAMVSSRSGQ